MPAKNPKKDNIEKLQEEVKQDASQEIAASEQAEVISTKKVIYIEIDDEVTTIYDKIRPIRGNHVYIVSPKRAILFQSIVNLKILKRKAEDGNKKIYLITNDTNGIHLAQKVGIPVYDKATSEGKTALFSTELNDERLKITPLKASVNEVEDEAPTRLAERKISISEILRKRKKRTENVVKITETEMRKPKKDRPKFVIVNPNRHALIGFVAVSVVILLFIIYIALPGVTIYLTPAASVLEKSVNITLADYQKNRAELETHPTHMIASYPIQTTVSRTLTHRATGKKFSQNASNASGNITIVNTTHNAWPLIPKTRFQTSEGIVFRISDYVTVPAATSAGPGKIDVFVTADQTDAYGVVVGERGNIGSSRFFLPGLRESSRSELYGESSAPMAGGVSDFVSYITATDIEAAKSRLNDELISDAITELRKAVQMKSELVESEIIFTLLEGEGAVKTGDVRIEIEPGLEGREIEEFSITGKIDVSGVYYDHDAMLSILKDELLLKKSPQKELLRINEGSTSYRIFEWNEGIGKIKLTANIKGIEQFEIDIEKENGVRLLEKIREHVAGQNIEEAKTYIQNLPEVNKVEIDSWPAWSPTIPNLPDNIDFEIRDAVNAE